MDEAANEGARGVVHEPTRAALPSTDDCDGARHVEGVIWCVLKAVRGGNGGASMWHSDILLGWRYVEIHKWGVCILT